MRELKYKGKIFQIPTIQELFEKEKLKDILIIRESTDADIHNEFIDLDPVSTLDELCTQNGINAHFMIDDSAHAYNGMFYTLGGDIVTRDLKKYDYKSLDDYNRYVIKGINPLMARLLHDRIDRAIYIPGCACCIDASNDKASTYRNILRIFGKDKASLLFDKVIFNEVYTERAIEYLHKGTEECDPEDNIYLQSEGEVIKSIIVPR